MKGLGAPCTPKEEAVDNELTAAYEYLVVYEKKRAVNGDQTVRMAEEMAAPTSIIGRTYREINIEMVIRGARNFRNTNRFRETVMRWTRNLRPPESGDLYVDMFCVGGTQRLWVVGIILFYKHRIQTLLERTGFFKEVFGDEKKSSVMSLVDRHTALDLPDITRIFQQVEKVDVDSLCRSTHFQEASELVPKMLTTFNLAVQLAGVLTSQADLIGDRTSLETTLKVVLSQQLSNPGWMHLLFVMMRSAQYMNDVRSDISARQESGGGRGAGNLSNNTASLEGLPSETSIQRLFNAITSIFGQIFDSNSNSLLNLLALRFARGACKTYYNPVTFTKLVCDTAAAQAQALQNAAPDHLDMPVSRSMEQIRADPLWRFLAIDGPMFIQNKRTFMEDGVKDEWLTTVLFRQLYLYRFPDGSAGGPEDASTAGANFYDNEEKDIVDSGRHQHLFFFHCLVATLRPLFHQLLIATPPRDATPGAGSAGLVVDVEAEAAARHAEHAESVAAAREAILTLARSVDLVDVQPCKHHLREWEILEVGPQPRSRSTIGRACFQKAVEVVMADLMKASLVWLTRPASTWPTFYASTTVSNNKSVLADEFELVVLRFLMRTESTYHALTDASARADGEEASRLERLPGTGIDPVAASATAAVDMQPLPDSLQACKSAFNDAVCQALNHYYPVNGRYVLVVPLIDAIHNYLMGRELRSGAATGGGPGGAPAARPPPRPGMKKMPPPPPSGGKQPAGPVPDAPRNREIIPLKSLNELHTALRLMGCADADSFFNKYRGMLQARFTCCPPPPMVNRDEEFDAKRIGIEQDANEYMRRLVGDTMDELRTIREVCATFKRSVHTIDGVKLVVSTLPWNLWVYDNKIATASAPLSSEARSQAVSTLSHAALPTPETPLPFPPDLSRAMDTFVSQREGAMGTRQLRWYGGVDRLCTTFELRYPRDQGRPTTIHGTLILQQLFLAISQYGRQGVPLDTLASRANLQRRDMDRLLHPCIHRDHLLVVRDANVVSLNYDFQRPETNKTGVFVYWPNPPRFCERISTDEQKQIHTERISSGSAEVIRIMKTLRKASFKKVEETTREKLANRFTVTTRLFKEIISELVEKKYIERGVNEDELNYLA